MLRDSGGLGIPGTVYLIPALLRTPQLVVKYTVPKSAEWKYLVAGPSRENEIITVVTKLGPTGKMVLITVFGDED